MRDEVGAKVALSEKDFGYAVCPGARWDNPTFWEEEEEEGSQVALCTFRHIHIARAAGGFPVCPGALWEQGSRFAPVHFGASPHCGNSQTQRRRSRRRRRSSPVHFGASPPCRISQRRRRSSRMARMWRRRTTRRVPRMPWCIFGQTNIEGIAGGEG